MDFEISKLKLSARIANKTEPNEWQTSQRKRHTPYFSVCKFFFSSLVSLLLCINEINIRKKGMIFVQSKVIWSKSVLCKSMCLCVSCACKSCVYVHESENANYTRISQLYSIEFDFFFRLFSQWFSLRLLIWLSIAGVSIQKKRKYCQHHKNGQEMRDIEVSVCMKEEWIIMRKQRTSIRQIKFCPCVFDSWKGEQIRKLRKRAELNWIIMLHSS